MFEFIVLMAFISIPVYVSFKRAQRAQEKLSSNSAIRQAEMLAFAQAEARKLQEKRQAEAQQSAAA